MAHHRAGRSPILDSSQGMEVLIFLKTGIDGVSGLSLAYSAAEAPARITVKRLATQIVHSQ